MSIPPDLRDTIEAWTREPFDAETMMETRHLLAEAERSGDWSEAIERFGFDLKFGTGGLRGVMGAGPNRVNAYTIARATQGIANYLKAAEELRGKELSAAIGYDSRRRSREFAMETARVFAANGVKARVFEALRPTPMLSFATMALNTTVGVMVTASHNPPEYNGYKVYWGNGQQVIGQCADDIIASVRAVGFDEIAGGTFDELHAAGKIEWIGADFDERYLAAIKEAQLSPELAAKHGADLKIVFTGLHGTGGTITPRALADWGFSNVAVVPEQDAPDGEFPTVKSPNPEERAALDLALAQAERDGADLVLGTDPDADRVGIAARDDNGELVLFNGNDTAVLLAHYLIERQREQGSLPKNGAIISTVVTTELLAVMAEANGLQHFEVLTGFKYIGELMNAWDNDGANRDNPTISYIFGGEESYGVLVGAHTRDKDAVSACCAIAEAAAWARERGTSLFGLLKGIHAKYGVYREGLLSKTLPGLKGMEQIAAVIARLRSDPPAEMLGQPLSKARDLGESVVRDASGKEIAKVDLPSENVVQLYYGDSLKITGRPSGTEPKIKFYIAANHREGLPLDEAAVPGIRAKLDANIGAAKAEIDKLIAQAVGQA